MPGRVVMSGEATSAAGWYGKIPYLGDFASRRLPQTFVTHWDSWLQQSIADSRNLLGARWLETYLHSPIWHFVLLPGVIDDNLWAGLMMPSVDRVGRHFPLTLALEVAPRPGAFVAVMAAREWYAALDDAVLATLNTEYTVEQFEASLAHRSFPEGVTGGQDTSALQLAAWWRQPAAPFEWSLPVGYTTHHMVCAASTQLFEAVGAGKSLWWSEAGNAGSRLVCFNGLPPTACYAALLEGHVTQAVTAPSTDVTEAVTTARMA